MGDRSAVSLGRHAPAHEEGVDALGQLFLPGFRYSKAEILLLNLCQRGEYTDDLFADSQPANTSKGMTVLDQINNRWGRGTLRAAIVPPHPGWGMGLG